ncbi:MAG: EAL domain-containing protein [Halarcobacter sp.]
MFKKNYKNLFIYTYVTSIVIVIVLISFIFNITKESDISKISIENLKSKMSERENFLLSYINTYKSSLLSLSQDTTFNDYLNDNSFKTLVNNQFLTIVKSEEAISKITYIGLDGFEKIRVKKNVHNKYIIEKDLQDSPNKEYLKEFTNLKRGQVSSSKIELRKELGEIVKPKEIILNLATPVYDILEKNRGVLIFTISLNKFFDDFHKTTLYNVYLVDNFGRYIFHYDKNKGLTSKSFYSYTLTNEFGKDTALKILNTKDYLGSEFYSKKIDNFENGQSLVLLLDLKYGKLIKEKQSEQLIFYIATILIAFVIFPLVLSFARRTDQLREKVNDSFNIDKLTDLPNRIELFSDLEKRVFENSIIILIHIDNYNKLKNVYGYEAIQIAVKKLSDFLISSEMSDDITKVYSVSKDSFALKYDYSSDLKLNSFLQELHNIFEKKRFYILDDLDISFDLTLAASNPYKLNNNVDELKEAEIALEHALSEKHDIYVYNEQVENNINVNRKNIEMVRVIKKAIQNDGVVVYFQPIYNNYKKKIEKYESLVRLKVDGKMYFPDEFLPISKDIKKYKTLTKIIIDKSFSFFKEKEFEFSINLTMEDIISDEIREYLFERIRNSTMPQNLVIEIVESESIKDYEQFVKFIKKVKSLGCKIAIDDFGSGYSNFDYIVKLNEYIDYLKIDGSLVVGIEKNKKNQLIIGTIKFLCDNLGIDTIVEYVENKESFDFIKSMNIDFSQGYYIGKPDECISSNMDFEDEEEKNPFSF